MSYNLFLDDQRKPSDVKWIDLPLVDWTVVHHFGEFVNTIKKLGIPRFVSYDCDLCDAHYAAYHKYKHSYPLHYKEFAFPCGIHCVEFLIKVCEESKRPHPPYIIHSMNQYGGGYMDNLIKKSLTKLQV